MPSNAIAARIEDFGRVDPKEVAKIEASLKGKEQAPRVVDQTGSFVDWQQVRDQLGSRFDVDRIPLRKLRQMRRDPMIAFGLHYRKTPLVRAEWHIEATDNNGPNAQVAGFMTSAWRAVHARYIFQHCLDFEFGWQSIVKRFAMGNPGGHYVDPTETDPTKRIKPVWDEGEVRPVIWKPFVALPPEKVAPIFNDSTGDFDGMIYDRGATTAAPTAARADQLTANQQKVDVFHSLWATNDKDSVFGSLYGYPLIAHAYRYWWSYWFRWAMADRAFERMAIPPLIAYHPEGDYTDAEGETRPYWEIAQEAAEALRSNAIATVPSTLATAGLDERGTQMREWAFEFLQVPSQNFDFLDKSFNYLDVMKLRSIWVPEQAFIEGEGGTSSRNVAAQMAEIFLESQANKWEEIADHINRFILPQLLVVNFPEFVNNGGSCRIVGHGFQKEDVEFMKQIIQLVGQGDPTKLDMMDLREVFERLGAPLKTPGDIAREQIEQTARAALQQPPAVNGGSNGISIVPRSQLGAAAGIAPGSTNGGSVPEPNSPGASVTGFDDDPMVFINPNQRIELEDHEDFLASLPATHHYSDKSMRALALQLRAVYAGFFRAIYPDFAKYVGNIQTIVLSDDGYADEEIHLADGDKVVTKKAADKAAQRLVNDWVLSDKRLDRISRTTQRTIERMVKQAIKLNRREYDIKEQVADDPFNAYVEGKAGALVSGVTKTVKDELQRFLANAIREGKTSDEISSEIQEHFADFDKFKADRIARSEVRDAMNAGSLLAAEASGRKYVQATDGEDFDVDCRNRNGKLFTIKEAWREMSHARTHPNCTLGFRVLARADFSVSTVEQLPPEAGEGADAWYDKANGTAYLPVTLSDDDAKEFLSMVVDYEERQARQEVVPA